MQKNLYNPCLPKVSMKIIKKEKNLISLIPETIDDLYILSKLLKGAELESSADRKIQIKGTDKQTRVKIHTRISIESLSFNPDLEILKANGKILEAKPEELAPLNSYQSIDIQPSKNYKIFFPLVNQSILDMLSQSKSPKTLLVLLDDEKAEFAWLSNLSLKKAGEIFSNKSGKQFLSESTEQKYFNAIEKTIQEKKPEYLIIAGPGFTKTKLSTFLQPKHKHETIGTSHTEEAGFKELLKSNLKKTLASLQILRDTELIDEFFKRLSKSPEKVCYGLEDTRKAISLNACSEILISEDYLAELQPNLKTTKAEIKIISTRHPLGKQFANFQSACFLHFPLS